MCVRNAFVVCVHDMHFSLVFVLVTAHLALVVSPLIRYHSSERIEGVSQCTLTFFYIVCTHAHWEQSLLVFMGTCWTVFYVCATRHEYRFFSLNTVGPNQSDSILCKRLQYALW